MLLKLRPLIVAWTAYLLILSGLLSIVAVFDSFLGWDVLSPAVEKIVMAALITLFTTSLIGFALSIVLAMSAIVEAAQSLANTSDLPKSSEGRISSMKGALIILATLICLVVGLSVYNSWVQQGRAVIFLEKSQEQMGHFDSKVIEELRGYSPDHGKALSQSIMDVMNTLEELTFISSVSLYIADPSDKMSLWRYSSCCDKYNRETGNPKRIFVSKLSEKAIASAFESDTSALEVLNSNKEFVYYHLIVDSETNLSLAVIVIRANKNESFRAY